MSVITSSHPATGAASMVRIRDLRIRECEKQNRGQGGDHRCDDSQARLRLFQGLRRNRLKTFGAVTSDGKEL